MKNSNLIVFNNKCKEIKDSGYDITDKERLELYGLYKQSLNGNITVEQPFIFSIKEREKWKAWNNCKDISKDDARVKYINLVNKIIDKYKE